MPAGVAPSGAFHICALYDIGEHESALFLVME
jgi:hypothetical protein